MATKAKPKPAARKRVAKKRPVKKKAAAAKSAARKRGEKLVNAARKRGRKVAKTTRKRVDSARGGTKKKATQLAVNVVEFQKTAFDNTVDTLGRLQKRSDRMISRAVKDVSWVPAEGKEVVEEWITTMEKARVEFKKSTDKSFNLLLKYLKRLEKGSPKKKAAAKTKKKAARKKPAKRKVASKRKAKAKPAATS